MMEHEHGYYRSKSVLFRERDAMLARLLIFNSYSCLRQSCFALSSSPSDGASARTTWIRHPALLFLAARLLRPIILCASTQAENKPRTSLLYSTSKTTEHPPTVPCSPWRSQYCPPRYQALGRSHRDAMRDQDGSPEALPSVFVDELGPILIDGQHESKMPCPTRHLER
jgi:hypothetical protein